MRISDWSSDVCSSDLLDWALGLIAGKPGPARAAALEALGSLGNTPERAARAIEALRGHLKQETDDAVLAMALYAAIELHGRGEPANPQGAAAIVTIAADRGGAEMRQRAMRASWSEEARRGGQGV